MRMGLWFAVAVAVALGRPAAAQSFSCSKARTPVEKAICADPGLGALDLALARAFADILQREPANGPALRDANTQWLRQRDAGCAVAAARLTACLSGVMTSRLAALAPPVQPPATVAVAPPPIAAQASAQPPRAEPRLPAVLLPAAAATLDRAEFPAAAELGTLLHVTAPGRFAITAQSATGTAIEIVDMLSGPSDPAGEPGVRDGRIDRLLDVGTYKIRATMADGATGTLRLDLRPFRAAGPPVAAPASGEVLSTTLADLEQLAVWLMVGPDGSVRLDTAGRSLADVRLWRQGTDLVDLQPDPAVIEPVRGHSLNRLRLVGKVEPGAYLLTAYGGPPIAWADSGVNGGAEQPLLLRVGTSDALLAGGASGVIGPFGNAVFAAPPRATAFRLTLPQSAPASLDVDGQAATIAQTSREPSVLLQTGTRRDVVEVTGTPGQAFRVRAMDHTGTVTITKPGSWWVSASALGTGGDEVPPTVLLTRSQAGQPTVVVAGTAPRIDPASPLRLRFNVRGPTSVLLQSTNQGVVPVRDAGQDTSALRGRPYTMDLVRDYIEYSIAPVPGKQGVADLIFGVGTPTAAPVVPANPVLPLGVQTIAAGQTLRLYANAAPGASFGLVARAAPVQLNEGPLTVTQVAGVAVEVPVAAGGMEVTDLLGAPAPFSTRTLQDGSAVITLPAVPRARTLVVAMPRPAVPRPDVVLAAPGAALPVAEAGAPFPFDLRREQRREFDLHVAEGGLYRLETLGRLQTAGTVGTAFQPALDQAEANGIGANMLIQRWLRAGRYRVSVMAQGGTAGHGALLASPAPLKDSPTLRPAGSIRARLPAGTGLRVPLEITEAGAYHLELQALGRTLTARLDDAEGWPLIVPGALTAIDRTLQPGRYQVLISPEAVETRVVARLTRTLPDTEIVGHGPHPLVFDAPRTATWREPPGRDDERVLDRWTFALAGPASVKLDIGDGMVGELRRDGADTPLGRFTRGAALNSRLNAGSYTVTAMSLGRNDRLDYAITLTAPELQPGLLRMVKPTAQVPFTLAEPGVVSLTSTGLVPLKAVLRDGAGAEIARYADRGSEWNLAIARPLPAGSYRLDLSPALPPATTDISAAATPPAEESGTEPDPAEPAPQSSAAAADTASEGDAAEEETRTVGLLLSLPPVRDAAGPGVLPGGFVHRLMVADAASDQLLLATARSTAEVVLALERRDATGGWITVGLAQGLGPVVAIPGALPGAVGPWRASVWAVDGGREDILLTAGPVQAAAQGPGRVRMAAQVGVAVARVALGTPGLVRVAGGVIAGGWAGHALVVPEDGLVAPQSDTLWLVGPAGAEAEVVPVAVTAALSVPVPAGARAMVTGGAVPAGTVRVWRADAGLEQPGLAAGQGMGVASGSALALGAGPVQVWHAGGTTALRPRVTPIDLALQDVRTLDSAFNGVLPPRSATPLVLPGGSRRTMIALAPGMAAVAGWRGPDAVTVWAPTETARVLPGAWTEWLLINTTDAPAPASLGGAPAPAETLQPTAVMKTFFGSAGSIQLPFDAPVGAPAGARLRIAGPATATVIAGDRVSRGRDIPLDGAGQIIVSHEPGAVAVWMEIDGRSPWPDAAPQAAALPSRMPLMGAAMALSIAPGGPVLLHVRTTAPVILTLGRGAPMLFPAGADLHRYVAADTTLRIDSPHDGPLSGTLAMSADPVIPVSEGLGEAVAVPPGGTAAFGFQIARAADVGLGLRAEPDRADTRLLRADGTMVGEGAALLQRLQPGRYVIEARNPSDATTALMRPAVIGITPRGAGPPPEVARKYLELVGLAPKDAVP